MLTVDKKYKDEVPVGEILKRDGRDLNDICNAILAGSEHAPALCKHGCYVAPEEMCTHGCRSLLRALALV